jgi:acetylornithine deacetylase/succinyl-diaminopimelate desuccinylase-like protein
MIRDDDGGLPPDLFVATLALLEELTAISSPSGDAIGLERMAARLAAELAARGLAAEVRRGLGGAGGVEAELQGAAAETQAATAEPQAVADQPQAAAAETQGAAAAGGLLPVVIARGPAAASAGHAHLLLVGHFDTVLPAVPPRRSGERLLATGAIDMKGGLATLLGALDLLARRGAAPPADLLVVAVPDEEVGGELAHAAVARWGASARALWVLEPGEPGSVPGAETLVGGRRGLFDWRLEARGKAAHSGLHPADGRSALLAAARWCLAATGDADGAGGSAAAAAARRAATGMTAGSKTSELAGSRAGAAGGRGAADGARKGAAVRAGGAGSMAGGGAARAQAESGRASAASGRMTVNVGRLVAGDASFVTGLATAHAWLGTERQLNVVPDLAIVEGEARFSTVAAGEEVSRRLARLAAEVGKATGTSLAFTPRPMIPPVDPRGPQRAWCERAVALAAARGWRLEVEEERGGISFPNFLPDPGRLPVLDGLGPVGGGMHTRDEYVDLVSLARRIVLLADLLQHDASPDFSRALVASRRPHVQGGHAARP